MDTIRFLLNNMLPINDEAWALFKSVTRRKNIQKKDRLIQQGDNSGGVFFVIDGCFRFFSVTENGQEAVKGFALERTFVASLPTLMGGTLSAFSIEALSDSIVLSFNWKDVAGVDYFEKLLNWHSHDHLMALERRQHEFLVNTPEERYLKFLQRSPEINKRVADLHIANYLGMTPVHLSRIRKNLKNLNGC